MWRRLDWRTELTAVAVALLAGLPLLLGRCYYLDDVHRLGLPLAAAVQRALQAGQPLVWNPDMFGGYSAIGAGQAGSYYPPNLLLLGLLPLTIAFRANYLFHFWLAARGAVGLAGELGLGRVGALASAGVVVLGGATAGHHLHFNIIVGMSWAAPILWLAVVACRRERPAPAVLGLGGCFGLALLQGQPQYVWLALLAAGCLVPWVAAAGVSPWRCWLRLAGGLGVGAGLALAQVLPTVEYLQQFPRQHPGGRFEYLASGGFGLLDGLRLLAPDLFGSPVDGSWRGEGWQYWEPRGFAGLCCGAAALVAVAADRRSPVTRAGLCLVVVATLLALGRLNPLYHLLVWIPPFSVFRLPARFVWLWQLGVAILAGRGIALLAAGEVDTRQRRWAGGLILAAAAAVAGVAWVHPDGQPWRWPGVWLLLAAGVVVAVLLLPARAPSPRATAWLVVAGLLELAVSWHAFAVTAPASRWDQPPPLAAPDLAGDSRRTVELDLRAPAGGESDPLGEVRRLVSNSGVIWGVSYLTGGNEALAPHGHLAVLRDLSSALARDEWDWLSFLCNRYSIRWLATSRELPVGSSWRLAASDAGVRLYENLTARPLCYAVPASWLTADGLASRPGAEPPILPVEVVARSHDRWLVRTRFDEPVGVVLAQSLYPGWIAMVSGQPGFLNGAERLFQVVEVPAGEHLVEFRYDSAAVYLGRQLSLVAVGLWLLAVGLAVWRRPRLVA